MPKHLACERRKQILGKVKIDLAVSSKTLLAQDDEASHGQCEAQFLAARALNDGPFEDRRDILGVAAPRQGGEAPEPIGIGGLGIRPRLQDELADLERGI